MGSNQKDVSDAVQSRNLDHIKQLFGVTDEVELFTYKDEGGRNALMAASMLGLSDMVTELVQNGAQVDESTVRGKTAETQECSGEIQPLKTFKPTKPSCQSSNSAATVLVVKSSILTFYFNLKLFNRYISNH